MVKEQLIFRFGWGEGYTFANYYAVDNAAAVHCIQQAIRGEGDQFVFLWGAQGVGKSHLLQAACEAAAEQDTPVAYLPLQELEGITPDVLEGMEQMALLCIDDVQCVLGDAAWEEALFHLYNRMRDAGSIMLVAADASPNGLPVKLPDLQTRLAWGPVFQLKELTEADKIAALQQRAAQRSFDLPDEVAQFLIRRSPRDMNSLFALLDKLDQESLAQQRKLTIPFVRGLV